MRHRPCIASLTSFLIATPLVAQEVSGTITGTLGLESAVWYVTTAPEDSLSGWNWDGNDVDIRMVGLVRREPPSITDGSLTIWIRTDGNPTEPDVESFTISYLSDGAVGEAGLVYSAGAENADLDIKAIEMSGDGVALAGSFAGQLIEGGAEELVLDSSAPSVTVDGNFQASLPRRDTE